MQLAELFLAERIFLDLAVSDREDLFRQLAEKAEELNLVNERLCKAALASRESLGSTGLGRGIAIPHARVDQLQTAAALFARLRNPIDFEAPDYEPVDIVLMLLLPEHSSPEQMRTLSRVARLARNQPIMDELRSAGSVDLVMQILENADKED